MLLGGGGAGFYAASVSRFFAGQLKNRELSTKKETDNG